MNSDKAAAALIATVTTRPLSSNGHRSDARMSPKVRFAIDSPLEQAGFEPSVSLAMELVSLAEGEGAGEVERGSLEKR